MLKLILKRNVMYHSLVFDGSIIKLNGTTIISSIVIKELSQEFTPIILVMVVPNSFPILIKQSLSHKT